MSSQSGKVWARADSIARGIMRARLQVAINMLPLGAMILFYLFKKRGPPEVIKLERGPLQDPDRHDGDNGADESGKDAPGWTVFQGFGDEFQGRVLFPDQEIREGGLQAVSSQMRTHAVFRALCGAHLRVHILDDLERGQLHLGLAGEPLDTALPA